MPTTEYLERSCLIATVPTHQEGNRLLDDLHRRFSPDASIFLGGFDDDGLFRIRAPYDYATGDIEVPNYWVTLDIVHAFVAGWDAGIDAAADAV